MLYAVVGPKEQSHYVLYCGDEINYVALEDIFANLTEIQVDGEELYYVMKNFKNLPHHTGSVQNWYGDVAKQIFKFFYDNSLNSLG